MDERTRDLERRADQGDLDAHRALLAALERAGDTLGAQRRRCAVGDHDWAWRVMSAVIGENLARIGCMACGAWHRMTMVTEDNER